MASDQSTSIADLRNEVQQFVAERCWEKFHSPKNISMALAVEAAELMEHFQWLSEAEVDSIDESKRADVCEELSDVFCYVLAMANTLDVDLTERFRKKMDRNRQKYPIEEIRGRFGHDDPNPVSCGDETSSQETP